MAAVLLLADLYKRPVHVCHVARREEVRAFDRWSIDSAITKYLVYRDWHGT